MAEDNEYSQWIAFLKSQDVSKANDVAKGVYEKILPKLQNQKGKPLHKAYCERIAAAIGAYATMLEVIDTVEKDHEKQIGALLKTMCDKHGIQEEQAGAFIAEAKQKLVIPGHIVSQARRSMSTTRESIPGTVHKHMGEGFAADEVINMIMSSIEKGMGVSPERK